MALAAAWRILGHAADAEDAVQEAFLAALRLYREHRVGNWGGLLRQLATRRALDLLRKRRASMTLESASSELAVSAADRPEALALAAERAALLRNALTRLPEREAEVFSLRYFGDLTNPQVAETLNLTPNAVAVALHKARSKLQTLLQPDRE